ncbi:MAG: adenylosuccinate lyase [Candidatus Sungbacteria bacterium]|uniref:Adenylosuccinate lyase n=1 Tax=Candidatus Sungiibacteriota bacterium TaxID=2750080 RepID=A0A932YZ19_9BACT|nr:adenylosuccinate lyase [Candidatus Sungbacteria bacterium]
MLKRYTLPPIDKLWNRPETQFEGWLDVEIAAMRARVALGELPEHAYQAIAKFRETVAIDVDRIRALERLYGHDMIAFIEAMRELLIAAGAEDAARQFHVPLTSYDIEDPALILRLREGTVEIRKAFHQLEETLVRRAKEHQWTLMIGRTHGQYAEPTTFGCLLMVFRYEVRRTIERLTFALDHELREGKMSGAVGAYGDIDPKLERLALGYLGLEPAAAETQILQRDRHASLLATYAVAAGVIEHMCRVFWELMRSEVRELEEPRTEKQRGSSAMPWKKNPILTERLQGMARLIRGYAVSALENIATPDWRDISQSSVERHIFPDATAVLYYMTAKAAELVDGLVVRKEEMFETLNVRSYGVWAGQRIHDALVEAGVEPNAAYEYVQRASFRVAESKLHLYLEARQAHMSETDQRTAEEIVGAERLQQLFDLLAYIKSGVEHIFREKEG